MKTANAFVALGALALAGPVLAQIPQPDTGNGGLTFIAYDDVAKHSLVAWLGNLTLSQVQPGNIDANVPAGGNFVLADYATAFTGSDPNNIRWMVVAADNVQTTGFNQTSLATTASSSPSGVQNNIGLRNSMANLNAMMGFVNAACPSASSCVGLSTADQQYAGVLDGQLNNPTDSSAPGLSFVNVGGVSDSLNFYLFSGTGTNQQTILNPTAYSGIFTLTGNVVHWASTNAVPLPAAVWLLVSGLLGVGSIARRRTTVKA